MKDGSPIERKVFAAYPIECEGARAGSVRSTVAVSLTVYDDGEREVGCPHLSPPRKYDLYRTCDKNPACKATFKCLHLYPKSSQEK